MPQHDGPCRAAVDIEIAGADAPFPQLDLPLVEAVDRAGEPVAGGVDQRDRLGEPLEAHHAENGAEKFGTVGGAPRCHAIFHAGGPEMWVVAHTPGHHCPSLPRLERLESLFQCSGGGPDERADGRMEHGGRTDMQALRGVAEHALELGVVIDLRLKQQQRHG